MKQKIRITETQLKNIIYNVLNEVTGMDTATNVDDDYDPYLDGTTSVYHTCSQKSAMRALDGGVAYITSNTPVSRFPGKIVATLRPTKSRIYGDYILELLVPASAVKVMQSHRDGEFCLIDPKQVYEIKPYNF